MAVFRGFQRSVSTEWALWSKWKRTLCHNLKRKTGSTEDANEFICCIYISKSLSCGATSVSDQHIAECRVKTEQLHFWKVRLGLGVQDHLSFPVEFRCPRACSHHRRLAGRPRVVSSGIRFGVSSATTAVILEFCRLTSHRGGRVRSGPVSRRTGQLLWFPCKSYARWLIYGGFNTRTSIQPQCV
jgi:hypothetical protein